MIFAGSIAVVLIAAIFALAFWGPDTPLAISAMSAFTLALGLSMKWFYDRARSG